MKSVVMGENLVVMGENKKAKRFTVMKHSLEVRQHHCEILLVLLCSSEQSSMRAERRGVV